MANPNLVNVATINGGNLGFNLSATTTATLLTVDADKILKINRITVANVDGTNAADLDLFVDGLSVASVGNHRVGAAQTGTEANWKNVGTSDQTVVFISPQSGNGAGILTVEYLQNRALA